MTKEKRYSREYSVGAFLIKQFKHAVEVEQMENPGTIEFVHTPGFFSHKFTLIAPQYMHDQIEEWVRRNNLAKVERHG